MEDGWMLIQHLMPADSRLYLVTLPKTRSSSSLNLRLVRRYFRSIKNTLRQPDLKLTDGGGDGPRHVVHAEGASAERQGGSSYYHRIGQIEPLRAALLDDPILADVPKKPTVADIDTLIAVELGSAMRLSTVKMDTTTFGKANVLCIHAERCDGSKFSLHFI